MMISPHTLQNAFNSFNFLLSSYHAGRKLKELKAFWIATQGES